ncbi:unnamed protein product [Pleuronectes platessa]|uniref:Uncharacterized protein n=1 Tax=Pleuronectes platessa TaxID=8262 RepID=A0A9N7U354_PLEPL|nr:unnamed protein product [Pleuronectes platessa]
MRHEERRQKKGEGASYPIYPKKLRSRSGGRRRGGKKAVEVKDDYSVCDEGALSKNAQNSQAARVAQGLRSTRRDEAVDKVAKHKSSYVAKLTVCLPHIEIRTFTGGII